MIGAVPASEPLARAMAYLSALTVVSNALTAHYEKFAPRVASLAAQVKKGKGPLLRFAMDGSVSSVGASNGASSAPSTVPSPVEPVKATSVKAKKAAAAAAAAEAAAAAAAVPIASTAAASTPAPPPHKKKKKAAVEEDDDGASVAAEDGGGPSSGVAAPGDCLVIRTSIEDALGTAARANRGDAHYSSFESLINVSGGGPSPTSPVANGKPLRFAAPDGGIRELKATWFDDEGLAADIATELEVTPASDDTSELIAWEHGPGDERQILGWRSTKLAGGGVWRATYAFVRPAGVAPHHNMLLRHDSITIPGEKRAEVVLRIGQRSGSRAVTVEIGDNGTDRANAMSALWQQVFEQDLQPPPPEEEKPALDLTAAKPKKKTKESADALAAAAAATAAATPQKKSVLGKVATTLTSGVTAGVSTVAGGVTTAASAIVGVVSAPLVVAGGAVGDVVRGQQIALFRRVFPEHAGVEVTTFYNCAWMKEGHSVPYQGFVYLTPNLICFTASLLEGKWDALWADVTNVKKKKSIGGMLSNAIEITTHYDTYFLTSFVQRDDAYRAIFDAWVKR
jgi:hypothetical protein